MLAKLLFLTRFQRSFLFLFLLGLGLFQASPSYAMFQFLKEACDRLAPQAQAILDQVMTTLPQETQAQLVDFHRQVVVPTRDRVLPQVESFLESYSTRLVTSWDEIERANPSLRGNLDTILRQIDRGGGAHHGSGAFTYYDEASREVFPLEERIQIRNQIIAQLRTQVGDVWGASETSMRTDVALNFLESLNRLELRYPHAIARAHANIQALRERVESLDPVTLGEDGENRRQAALRALIRFQGSDAAVDEWSASPTVSSVHITLPAMAGRRLNLLELMSLTWEASHDSMVFSPLEISRQEIAIAVMLAFSQRAHNDAVFVTPDRGVGIGGAINFDPAIADSPSCAVGTTIRTLEPLEASHPDVRLQPHVTVIIAPTPAEVAREQLEFARSFVESHSEMRALHAQEGCLQSLIFIEFRVGLAAHLRGTFPGLSPQQLEGSLAPDLISTLIEHACESAP